MLKSFLKRKRKSAVSILLSACLLSAAVNGIFSISASTVSEPSNESYNAAEAVQKMLDSNGALNTEWGYTSSADGNLLNYQVDSSEPAKLIPEGYDASGNVYLYVKDGKLCYRTPAGNEPTIPSLTFKAPKDGRIKLYDPDNGSFEINYDDTDYEGWPRHQFVIYHNDKQIWPTDAGNCEIGRWAGGKTIPEIYENVLSGDTIRIVRLWNQIDTTVQCNLQVDYMTSITTEYNAYETVKSEEDRCNLTNYADYTSDRWIYEIGTLSDEATIALEKKAFNKWYGSGDDDLHRLLPNSFWNNWVASAGKMYAFGTYGNKVIMSAPTVKDLAVALTFVAPDTGTVKLYDPTGGNIGVASQYDPFYTLNDENEKIGLAIYKNNEKIWPENEEYYSLTYNNTEIAFPEISGIKVTKDDMIRFVFRGIENNWGAVALSPQVEYTQLEGVEKMPIGININIPSEKIYEGKASSITAEARYSDGTVSAENITVNVSDSAGEQIVTAVYDDGTYKYTKQADVYIYAKGDLDGDKAVNNTDMGIMRGYILGKITEIDIYTADFNTDDKVDILDFVRLNSVKQ